MHFLELNLSQDPGSWDPNVLLTPHMPNTTPVPVKHTHPTYQQQFAAATPPFPSKSKVFIFQ